MAATTVSIDGLTMTYRGQARPVVDGVSLVVEPGSITALLGPSGCGKTTSLKLVAGLLSPDAGDVRFDDTSVLAVAAEARSVAMVFQKPLLFPHMTVGQNVGFGLRVRRLDKRDARAEIERMLELVQLPDMADRPATELSGGMEQRVALARALVVRPKVLLLDEPLSQLDAGPGGDARAGGRGPAQRRCHDPVRHPRPGRGGQRGRPDRLMFDGRIEQHGVPRDFWSPARWRRRRSSVQSAACTWRVAGTVLEVTVPPSVDVAIGRPVFIFVPPDGCWVVPPEVDPRSTGTTPLSCE